MRILMVAFHFPPFAGSSGIQRTLRFAQHLPTFGWEPIVLTAHPRAYGSTNDSSLNDVPHGLRVERAFALDAARHLSVRERYPVFLALPDRWSSWAIGALPAGLRLIRQERPNVLWSTYPIATAHFITACLHRASGLPWIADFRDPMAQEGYPQDPRVWRSYMRIESATVRRARFSVFCAPGAAATYRERYGDVSRNRIRVIENGYDEESFATAESGVDSSQPLVQGCITLLHSGIVYPSERDPTALIHALAMLARERPAWRERLRVRFRAPVHSELLTGLARAHGVDDMVGVLPSIPYRDALAEMLRADCLLLMQGANCNDQIPAKLYEYFRAQRPILGLADPSGDTGRALASAGVRHIARLESTEEIYGALVRLLAEVKAGTAQVPSRSVVSSASRRARTAELAALLDQAAAE